MGKTFPDREKNDQNVGGVFYSPDKHGKLTGDNAMYASESKTWKLVKGAKPGRELTLKLVPSETRGDWLQELFLKQSPSLGVRIPKHLVSLDEKYFRRCLELIHMNVSKGAPCPLTVNMSSLDMEFMSDCVTAVKRNSFDGTKYRIDQPVDLSCEDFLSSPSNEGIVGSIMGSSSMMSILNSPLFQKLGVLDHGEGFGGTSLFENKRCAPCDYQGSSSRLTFSPSKKLGRETFDLRRQGYTLDPVQRSRISMSSRVSEPVDHSSATSDSQGMLQCTWEGGFPHFAFSLDDQKELYVASAWKVEDTRDKALNYVYSFHLKPSAKKLSDISDNESDIIGKMKVSTSFSLCSSNSKVMQTEFVFVGANESDEREMYALTRSRRRSRKLSKVMEIFKSGSSLKQRTSSVFGGTSAIPEDAERPLEVPWYLERPYRLDLSENDFLPNREMAAIVVKNHVQNENFQSEKLGGWGLKFLKKNPVKQSVVSLDVSVSSECCLRNTGDCSTSMDIILPAGPHGGPRTMSGGPSSLIERWRLGGHCDCGGWDIGCPLKVLKARPRGEAGFHSTETLKDCKSFDLFTEGTKQEAPMLKMVNIHDNLYFISFQPSSLSALQCFSIAVAIIHSKSPTLCPKHVQE